MIENCFSIGNFSIQQDVCKTQMPSIKADSKDGLRQKTNTLKAGQIGGYGCEVTNIMKKVLSLEILTWNIEAPVLLFKHS